MTGGIVPLFHPRDNLWTDHFEFLGPEVVGRTPAGRATVRLLQMNSERRLRLRKELLEQGVRWNHLHVTINGHRRVVNIRTRRRLWGS